MSDDLLHKGALFSGRYQEACRMGRRAVTATALNKRVAIYGMRGDVKHPLMSVLVAREFGNARHALAQRVVAGTMTVHTAPDVGPPRIKADPTETNPSPSTNQTAPTSSSDAIDPNEA